MSILVKIADLDLSNKIVLVREDYNVPLENGEISDNTRITATLPTLKQIQEAGAKIIIVSHLGRPEEGKYDEKGLQPSSEWRFHKDIYLKKTDAKAVVHAHSPHATAVSAHNKDIPAFHYMIALAGGDNIKCAKYATFGTQELSDNIIEALENRKACLMSNHGQVAYGDNLNSAFELAEEVENICHQYINAIKLGEPKILSSSEMDVILEKVKNYKKG